MHNAYSQGIQRDNIYAEVVQFLNVTEGRDFTDRGSDNMISIRDDITGRQIGNVPGVQMKTKVKVGVYSFSPISSFNEYTHIHLLLIDNVGFEIINMRDSLERNLAVLVDFLKNNPAFTKRESLLYIEDFLRISYLNTNSAH